MSARISKRGAIAAGVGLALGAASGEAQREGGLEEILVTARYRQENLQQTPLAITAISGEALQLRSLDNLEDIGVAIPNAFIVPNVNLQGPNNTIGLRDVIQTDFGYSFEPAVGIYIDDVYHGTLSGSSFDLLDLERVEVLRGPQGTLFGKNSLGGAIRLFSTKPTGDDTGYVEATYGEFDRVDLKGVYDFTLVPDKASIRVAGVSKHRDGYREKLDFTCDMVRRGTPERAGIGDGIVGYTPDPDGPFGPERATPILGVPGSPEDNAFSFPSLQPAFNPTNQRGCVTGTMEGEDLQAARIMLNLTPSDRLELGIAVDFSDEAIESSGDAVLRGIVSASDAFYRYLDESVFLPRWGIGYYANGESFVPESPYQSYATWSDPVTGERWDPLSRTESDGVSFSVDYDLGDKTHMRLIAANRGYHSDWTNDIDNSPLEIITNHIIQDHDQDTFEAQFTGSVLNDRLEWTTGLFYYDAFSYWGGHIVIAYLNNVVPLPGSIPEFDHNDRFTTKNKSAFVHFVADLTEKLSFSGGVRSTDEDKTFGFDHTGFFTIADPLIYGQSRTDWKVSFDYTFNDNVFGFLSVATGYRSDGANPRPFVPNQLLATPAEELVNTELGIKTDLLDDRLRLNANIFYSDYDPRVTSQFGLSAQCNLPTDPAGPGVFHEGFQPCPAGTALAGRQGIPWIYYYAVTGEIEGLELEVSASPTDNFSLNYSFGYNKFETQDLHESVLLQPERSMSLGLQYDFRFSRGGTLSPRLDWFYQGKRTNGPQAIEQICPAHCIPDYDYMNARLTYIAPNNDWSVSLAVTNLTDEFWWYQLSSDYGADPNVPTSPRTGVPSAPRMWAVSLRKNFGG